MNLPIYDAIIDSAEDGMFVMSLVTNPATQTDWVCFSDNSKLQTYSIIESEDPEKHLLAGVVMLADTPIYRRNADGFEYYIKYSKETIRKMSEKALSDNTVNNIDIQHNGEILPKGVVTLQEIFIKDEAKGINPVYLSEIPDGSLCATYKVNDEALWQLCKDGTLNGFSLAGMFTMEHKFSEIKPKRKNMLTKIKETLTKLLMEFNEVKTDNGILFYDGEELTKGTPVTDQDGIAIADGEYATEDGKVYVVVNGIVDDVKDAEVKEEPADVEDEPAEEETAPEAEAEPTDEVKEDEPAEEVEETPEVETEPEVEETAPEATESEEPTDNKVDKIEADVEDLKSELAAIKEQLAALLATPAVEPIAEEFQTVTKTAYDKKVQRACDIAKYIKA